MIIEYGIDNSYIDVSKNINIDNKKYLMFHITNENLNIDPVKNIKKKLKINYNNNNYIFNENDIIFFDFIKNKIILLPKNIITKYNISIVQNIINNYKECTVFGKGPTFKLVNKNENEFRIAINQAANIINEVDMICINDHHNLFLINDNVYKNLKILLIPEYLHINCSFNIKGNFINIYDFLTDKGFNGYIILYNLNTTLFRNNNIINLPSALTSSNNAIDFIALFTNIKNITTYGIGVNSDKNYNDLFIGNGNYNSKRTTIIKNEIIKVCKNNKVNVNII